MRSEKFKKTFVGLSGGVDSSVSAALLKNAGYSVTGVFIRVWQPDFFHCDWKDDRLDAMRVCAKLNIPFVELALEKEYKKEVVDYMIREYKAGKTPNPDVFCNRFIKFGEFYKFARKEGADFIATGHYARIVKRLQIKDSSKRRNSADLNFKSYNLQLLAGTDKNKDQSYFLWQIRREQLPHILFPVGGMKKPEVRKLAKKFGLITADKKDSQGLCFVGKVNMKEFLSHYIRPKKGKVLDERGKVVGEHNGAELYTLGERLGVSPRLNLKSGKRFNLERPPLYVVAKDILQNILIVSPKTPSGDLPRARTEVVITDCNWLINPTAGRKYLARVRYRQPLQRCVVAFSHGREQMLRFEKPQIAAPGQSLVIYDGDIVAGGGVIAD